ncbi:MAG TPA: glycosyltransferase family 2 protein [bacterium]|jgi:GT2 family glycosyltransferase
MSVQVSVVVPTFNRADLLDACLRALVAQTLSADQYEIIVADDGSTDRTPALLAAHHERSPHIRPLPLPVNRGRSAARNAAIRSAGGRVIVFVDSDVIVTPEFVFQHLQMHVHSGPRIVSRGPVVSIPAPDAIPATVPPLAASPSLLNTANAGVEKSALMEAGLFDEGFPGYGWEDFELGQRLAALGLRRVFSRQAVAFHVEPDPAVQEVGSALRKEEERARSAAYFLRKRPSFETRLLIQLTPLHRAAYWIQSGGGAIGSDNARRVVVGLQRAGLRGLAALAFRGVLNRHYLQTLRAELKRRPEQP